MHQKIVDTHHEVVSSMAWTLEECVLTLLLLPFLTHFYIPVLEPVQDSLFTATSDEMTSIGQFILAGIWVVAGPMMLRKHRRILAGARRMKWTVLFTAFAFASAFWSQDPGVTMRKATFLLLTTAFGIYFASCYSVQKQLRMICVAACLISCLSIGFALFLPDYGLDHDVHQGVWTGVFTQKNVCARELLFLLACLIPYRPMSQGMRWIRRVAISATGAVIAGTQSKTAFLMVAMVLCFFASAHILRKLNRSLMLIVVSSTAVLLLAGCMLALSAVPELISMIGRNATLTGRTDIWQSVFEAILKRPLLGYGFAAFWLSLHGESANIVVTLRWAVPAAHNGFLEVWLQLGAVGLILFTVDFLKAGFAAVQNYRHTCFQQATWPLGVLLLTLAYNLDESSLMQPNDFLWVLYVVTLVNLLRPAPARAKAPLAGRTQAVLLSA